MIQDRTFFDLGYDFGLDFLILVRMLVILGRILIIWDCFCSTVDKIYVIRSYLSLILVRFANMALGDFGSDWGNVWIGCL